MIKLTRTDASSPAFRQLVISLDKDLALRDGDDHPFFAQFNKLDMIKHVVLAFEGDEACGCGAMKECAPGIVEIKRMFVPAQKRGQGIASAILLDLEEWARELGYGRCILETGEKQPEAIGLYRKAGYRKIPNYGQYADVAASICFEKEL